MHILRRVILIVLLATSCVVAQKESRENLPNILVILIDDAGYADFGFMGSEDLKTPHIDQLASEGIIFTDAIRINWVNRRRWGKENLNRIFNVVTSYRIS